MGGVLVDCPVVAVVDLLIIVPQPLRSILSTSYTYMERITLNVKDLSSQTA